MEILKYATIIFSVGLLVPLILNLMKKHNEKIEKQKVDEFTICIPKWLLWSLILFCLLFMLVIIMANITSNLEIYVNITFISFECIMLVLSLLLFRNRVVYSKGNVTFYPFLKKKKVFKITDIEEVRMVKLSNGTKQYKMYKNNKKILSLNDAYPYVNTFMRFYAEKKTEFNLQQKESK